MKTLARIIRDEMEDLPARPSRAEVHSRLQSIEVEVARQVRLAIPRARDVGRQLEQEERTAVFGTLGYLEANIATFAGISWLELEQPEVRRWR